MVNRRSSQISRKSAFTLLSTEVSEELHGLDGELEDAEEKTEETAEHQDTNENGHFAARPFGTLLVQHPTRRFSSLSAIGSISEELNKLDDKLKDAEERVETTEHQETNENGHFAVRPFDAVLVPHPTRRLSTFSTMTSITGSMISGTADFSSLSTRSNLNGSLNGLVIEGLSSLRRNGATPKEVAAALEEILNGEMEGNVSGSMVSLDSLTSYVMRIGITDSLNLERTNNMNKIDAPPSDVTGQGVSEICVSSHDISAALEKLFGSSSIESGDSMKSLDTLSSFVMNGLINDSVKLEKRKTEQKRMMLRRNRSGRRRGHD